MIKITDLDLQSNEKVTQVLSIIEKYLGKDRFNQASSMLENKSANFVIAEFEDKIIACAAYGFSGFHYNTWWIGLAAVEIEFRKMGISTQLVEYRLKKIKNLGGRWVIAASLEPIDRVLSKGFVKVLDMDVHKLITIDLKEHSFNN